MIAPMLAGAAMALTKAVPLPGSGALTQFPPRCFYGCPTIMLSTALDKPPCPTEYDYGPIPTDCTSWVLYRPSYVLDPKPLGESDDCDPKAKPPWGFRCIEVRDLEREKEGPGRPVPVPTSSTPR